MVLKKDICRHLCRENIINYVCTRYLSCFQFKHKAHKKRCILTYLPGILQWNMYINQLVLNLFNLFESMVFVEIFACHYLNYLIQFHLLAAAGFKISRIWIQTISGISFTRNFTFKVITRIYANTINQYCFIFRNQFLLGAFMTASKIVIHLF